MRTGFSRSIGKIDNTQSCVVRQVAKKKKMLQKGESDRVRKRKATSSGFS
jgi:hypothetical protein